MAQVYYLDVDNLPEPTGDSYALFDQIDGALSVGGFCDKWKALSDAQKEDIIKELTARIDALYIFSGEKYDADQPLQFPRVNIGPENYFGIQAQKRSLLSFIKCQIEFELVRLPIGIQHLSEGNQSVEYRQQTTCREAMAAIYRFLI